MPSGDEYTSDVDEDINVAEEEDDTQVQSFYAPKPMASSKATAQASNASVCATTASTSKPKSSEERTDCDGYSDDPSVDDSAVDEFDYTEDIEIP